MVHKIFSAKSFRESMELSELRQTGVYDIRWYYKEHKDSHLLVEDFSEKQINLLETVLDTQGFYALGYDEESRDIITGYNLSELPKYIGEHRIEQFSPEGSRWQLEKMVRDLWTKDTYWLGNHLVLRLVDLENFDIRDRSIGYEMTLRMTLSEKSQNFYGKDYVSSVNVKKYGDLYETVFGFDLRLVYEMGWTETPAYERSRMLYKDYLKTDFWKYKRHQAKKAAGYKCQLCSSTKRLDVHHNRYDNRGHEPLYDLTVLCRSCHSKFHSK